MSVCKFHQRGVCKFGYGCRSLHQPAPLTSRANQAPCVFFVRGQCIKGDACSFAHPVDTEPRSQDAIDPGRANIRAPCRFWSKGTCKKGGACPFVHSETAASTDDALPERPVSTPTLTSRTPTTESEESREISTLHGETAALEIHGPHASLDLEGIKQHHSQEMSADTALGSSSESISPLILDLDISSHPLSTGSIERCRTKIPLATLNSSTSASLISWSVKITPKNFRQQSTPLDAPPRNVSSSECGAASVVEPVIHTADNCPDGESCGFHRATSLQDSANTDETSPSYEQSLAMEGIEYLEEAGPVVPDLAQDSKALLQDLPHERDLDSEGDDQVAQPLLTSTTNWTMEGTEFPEDAEPVVSDLVQHSKDLLQDLLHERELDLEGDDQVAHPLFTSTKNWTMEGTEFPEEAEPVVSDLVQHSKDLLQDLLHERELDLEGSDQVAHPLFTSTKNWTTQGTDYPEEAGPVVPVLVLDSAEVLPPGSPREHDSDSEGDNQVVHPALTSTMTLTIESIEYPGEAGLVASDSVQNGTGVPQSDSPYEGNLDSESGNLVIQPLLDAPHWSQYADPLADPTIPFCNFFAQARCNQGDVCSFRHSITVNEYALLFRDPQPTLWSSRAQVLRAENAIPSTVSAFGVCKFYPLGTCRNGESCPYLHAPPPTLTMDSWPNEDYTEPAFRSNSGREVRPCRYYVRDGCCNKGDQCQFRHNDDQFSSMHSDQDAGRNERHNNDYDQEVDRRTRPCRYFDEGNCRNGSMCRLLHDKPDTKEGFDGNSGETASNGWDAPNAADWGEPTTVDWGEPTTVDWGEPTTNGMAKEDSTDNQRTPMVDSLADVNSRRMENATNPTNDGTAWSAPRRARDSGLCRFYTQGQCKWDSRCKYRHNRADHDFPPEDSRGGRDQVENDPPTRDSWSERMEMSWGVLPQAEGPLHDPIGSETPPKNTWGETAEMPSDVAAPGDQPFQASSGDLTQDSDLGQPDEPRSAATTKIHKWAVNVAETEEVESQSLDDSDEKTWSTPWSDDVIQSTTPVRIRAPCKAFGQGHCPWGDSCQYQHIAPPAPVLEAQSLAAAEESTTEIPEDLQSVSNQPSQIAVPDHLSVDRNIFNCTMSFSSGCLPTNILTACESRRIRLSNVSPTLTHDDLRGIVSVYGMVLDLIIDAGEESANATIEFGDPAQALDAISHLDGQTYNSMLVGARLDTIAMERTMQPLVSRTLKLSWLPPVMSAWAMYPTITIAKAQENRLDGWALNGRKIKAEFHRPRPKQTHSFGVKLTGLPTQTTKKFLEELCEESTMIVLETATYQSQPVNNAICDLLANLGLLESFDVPSWEDDQSEIIGFARFCMDTTSLEGVMALNATPQPFLGGSSLSIRHVFHAKYDLSNRLFNVLRSEIDRLASIHKPYCGVSFYENGDQGNVVLHIHGDFKGPEKFGRCNTELQALLEGEILVSEGKGVWDEYFDTSSSAKTLEKMNADSPFFIQIDKRTQAIHIIGSESGRQAGRAIVSRLLKKVRAQRWVLPVDMFSLHGLLTGGYQSLQDDMGPNKVTLDVVTSELIVRGDSDAVNHVQLSLDTHTSISHNDSPAPNLVEGGGSCPICYRTPTNPIKLSCRHAYCQACLQHILRTSAGVRFSPPRCIATAAGENKEQGQQCTENIPYTVVRDLLRTDEEEQLLKTSFLHHARNHPDRYFFCPAPNCETVYGHGREGVVYRCPSCSTDVCSSCHLQYHEGLTCSERREILGK